MHDAGEWTAVSLVCCELHLHDRRQVHSEESRPEVVPQSTPLACRSRRGAVIARAGERYPDRGRVQGSPELLRYRFRVVGPAVG